MAELRQVKRWCIALLALAAAAAPAQAESFEQDHPHHRALCAGRQASISRRG